MSYISALTKEEIFINRTSLSSIQFCRRVCIIITNNNDSTNKLYINYYLNDER